MKLSTQFRCVAACATLSCSLANGLASKVHPDVVKVYRSGGDISDPKLIPAAFTTEAASGCEKPLAGTVTLATIVDASGQPRNTMFVHPARNDLDKLALNILAAERFNAGEKNGAAVAVSQTVEMQIEACLSVSVDSNGKQLAHLQTTSQPRLLFSPCDQYPDEVIFAAETNTAELGTKSGPKVYRLSDGVSMPVGLWENTPISVGQAKQGGKVKYEGAVLLNLIVDTQGMPQRVKVLRQLGMGLDEKAIEAVERSRFKPGMLKGKEPVPVELGLEIHFRLY
jgi:TonB family protein